MKSGTIILIVNESHERKLLKYLEIRKGWPFVEITNALICKREFIVMKLVIGYKFKNSAWFLFFLILIEFEGVVFS